MHDGTAYVESAQAVGLHLLADAERDPERTTSAGLAALLEAALDSGAAAHRRRARRLGHQRRRPRAASRRSHAAGARSAWRGVDLVAATDVDNPLLGPAGATAVFGPQKGADREAVARLEGRMQAWVAELDGLAAVADRPGAGAAGGLGAALYWLGGRREPGAALVAEAIGLEAAMHGRRPGRHGGGDVRRHLAARQGRRRGGRGGRRGRPCPASSSPVRWLSGMREAAAHGVDETLSPGGPGRVRGGGDGRTPQQWLASAGLEAGRALVARLTETNSADR